MEKDGGDGTIYLSILDGEPNIGPELDKDAGTERGDGVLGWWLGILGVGHGGAGEEHEEHEEEGGDGEVGFFEVGLDDFDVVVAEDAGVLGVGVLLGEGFDGLGLSVHCLLGCYTIELNADITLY